MIQRVYRFASAAAHLAAKAQQHPTMEIVVGPLGDPPTGHWVLAAWLKVEGAAWASARQPEASAPVWWSGVPFSAAEPEAAPEVRPEDMPALTPAQLELALLSLGKTAAMVEAAIAAIPDAAVRQAGQVLWRRADRFERSHPLIGQLGPALGLTEAQINALWMAAAAGN